MNILDLSPNQLKRAAAIKEQIDRLSRELHGILDAPSNSDGNQKKNRAMSPAVKRKIAAAQKARWASLRRSKPGTHLAHPSVKPSSNAKSPATKAKLSAKMKAYWAAKRAGRNVTAKNKEGKA